MANKAKAWLAGLLAATWIGMATGTAYCSDAPLGEAKEAWTDGRVGTVVTARLTAYDPCGECTGKGKDDPAYGITKSGTRATAHNTVAVDPSVIPLGSSVYIEGLGVFRAEDTGGAIRGDRVDVFMDTHEEALVFGVRTAKVHVLDL